MQAAESGLLLIMLLWLFCGQGVTRLVIRQIDNKNDTFLQVKTDKKETSESFMQRRTDKNNTSQVFVQIKVDKNDTSKAFVQRKTDKNDTNKLYVQIQGDENGTSEAFVQRKTDKNDTNKLFVQIEGDENGTSEAFVQRKTDKSDANKLFVQIEGDENGTSEAFVQRKCDKKDTSKAFLQIKPNKIDSSGEFIQTRTYENYTKIEKISGKTQRRMKQFSPPGSVSWIDMSSRRSPQYRQQTAVRPEELLLLGDRRPAAPGRPPSPVLTAPIPFDRLELLSRGSTTPQTLMTYQSVSSDRPSDLQLSIVTKSPFLADDKPHNSRQTTTKQTGPQPIDLSQILVSFGGTTQMIERSTTSRPNDKFNLIENQSFLGHKGSENNSHLFDQGLDKVQQSSTSNQILHEEEMKLFFPGLFGNDNQSGIESVNESQSNEEEPELIFEIIQPDDNGIIFPISDSEESILSQEENEILSQIGAQQQNQNMHFEESQQENVSPQIVNQLQFLEDNQETNNLPTSHPLSQVFPQRLPQTEQLPSNQANMQQRFPPYSHVQPFFPNNNIQFPTNPQNLTSFPNYPFYPYPFFIPVISQPSSSASSSGNGAAAASASLGSSSSSSSTPGSSSSSSASLGSSSGRPSSSSSSTSTSTNTGATFSFQFSPQIQQDLSQIELDAFENNDIVHNQGITSNSTTVKPEVSVDISESGTNININCNREPEDSRPCPTVEEVLQQYLQQQQTRPSTPPVTTRASRPPTTATPMSLFKPTQRRTTTLPLVTRTTLRPQQSTNLENVLNSLLSYLNRNKNQPVSMLLPGEEPRQPQRPGLSFLYKGHMGHSQLGSAHNFVTPTTPKPDYSVVTVQSGNNFLGPFFADGVTSAYFLTKRTTPRPAQPAIESPVDNRPVPLAPLLLNALASVTTEKEPDGLIRPWVLPVRKTTRRPIATNQFQLFPLNSINVDEEFRPLDDGEDSSRPSGGGLLDRLRNATDSTKRRILASLSVGVPIGAALMAAAGAPIVAIVPMAAVIPGYILAAFMEDVSTRNVTRQTTGELARRRLFNRILGFMRG